MNTRLQVEHPITEMVTGVDLVQWQIRIARGERLTLDPEALLTPRGHAIECRIYAEDPGRTASCPRRAASRACARRRARACATTAASYAGVEVPIFYDPMISKLITWGDDRAHGHRAHDAGAGRVRGARHHARRSRSSAGC